MNKPFAQETQEIAQAANLLAHPAAGAMALSAMGLGIASQAVGSWAGAMMVAAEASQRFWAPFMVFAETPAATEEPAAASKPVARVTKEASDNVVPIGKIMREKSGENRTVHPETETVAPTAADDLKVISGIGPKMEHVLNGLGVRSYEQIASWGDKDIAGIEDALGFKGRVGRDDWVGQAAALSRQSRTVSGSEG